MRKVTTEFQAQKQPRMRLVIIAGPRAGLSHELEGKTTVGRGDESTLAIDADDVSRAHVEVRMRVNGIWEVEDLRSLNGTRVNGLRIQRRDLRVGDTINLGKEVVLLFTDCVAVADSLTERQKFEVLGRVAAGIAHDFNNVLGVLSATVGCLRGFETDAAPDDEELASCLDDMQLAISNGARLANRLVSFTRRSRGRARVDVSATCTDIAQMCRRAFESSIQIDLAVDGGLFVVADDGALEQVLMNLCVNARDAMPGGGTITIRAHRRSPKELGDRTLSFSGAHVVITVEDTGTGIGEADLPRIFETFYTTKPTGAGYGVGLATVRELVTLHGGTVDVATEPGKGTSFRVYLPAPVDHSVRAPMATLRDRRSEPPAGGRILLTDDDELVRRSTARVLTRAGFTVVGANGGREALRLYEEGPTPDLVILDLDMPGLGGLETLVELRRAHPGVKALVLTGHRDPVKEEAVRAAGAEFMSKPFGAPELVELVRRLMDQPDEKAPPILTPTEYGFSSPSRAETVSNRRTTPGVTIRPKRSSTPV